MLSVGTAEKEPEEGADFWKNKYFTTKGVDHLKSLVNKIPIS